MKRPWKAVQSPGSKTWYVSTSSWSASNAWYVGSGRRNGEIARRVARVLNNMRNWR